MGWGRLGMRCIRNGEYSERGSFVGGSGVGGWEGGGSMGVLDGMFGFCFQGFGVVGLACVGLLGYDAHGLYDRGN